MNTKQTNDLHQHLLDMLGAKDHQDAGRIIGELHAAKAHPSRGVVDELGADEVRDLWMATDADGITTTEHLRRFAKRIQAAALPAVPDRCCAACKGSGEVEALTQHASGDPQDAYEAPATCPVCDGTGEGDPWMPVDLVLPMAPGWYVCVNHGRVEPLRFDGAYWHHTRMTRDLAGPSHWRTFESIATPAHDQPEGDQR